MASATCRDTMATSMPSSQTSDLTDSESSIPLIEFELFTNVGTFPSWVSAFNPAPDGTSFAVSESHHATWSRVGSWYTPTSPTTSANSTSTAPR